MENAAHTAADAAPNSPLTHYERALRRLLSDEPLAARIAMRLALRLDRSGGPDACWVYQMQRLPNGYAMMSIFNERDAVGASRSRMNYAHRIAYVLHYKCLPVGGQVLHRCDNRGCCNPAHLAAGTQKQNIADMQAKRRGNYPTGPRPTQKRFTAAQALGVVRMLGEGAKCRTICAALKVNPKFVYSVRSGETWRSVTGIAKRTS